MRIPVWEAVAAASMCSAGSGSAQAPSPAPQTVVPAAPSPDPGASAAPEIASVRQSPVLTLQQVLVRTYRTNPTLTAQRAARRGLDSRVALARAEGRPQIATSAGFTQEVFRTRTLGTLGRGVFAGAGLEQIMFAGGRIRNLVRAADTRVVAGRAELRSVEGDVLSEAVTAYADLVRDRDILVFTADQVKALELNLSSARARLRVGDLTRADVSQSEARLALAQSSLAVAEGRLQASEENFERVVGARAGILAPLPPLPPLPSTMDRAVEIALSDNAELATFVARTRAAAYDVSATKAERLPTLSAVSSTAYSNALGTADRAAGVPAGTLPNSATNIGIGVALRLPIYQGGAASARVRLAEEERAQLVEQTIAAERFAIASARAAFAVWQSFSTAIAASERAVAANEVALKSVKVEQTVGARSILDVLNAEQELLGSKIALAGARRDAYVAAFVLLDTMGAAEAADLNLGPDPLYDPEVNYRAYADEWSDWADGSRRAPVATRTAPEQLASPVDALQSALPTKADQVVD